MNIKHILLTASLGLTALVTTSCNFSTEQKQRIVRREAGKDDFRDSEKWGKVVTQTIETPAFTHIHQIGNADIKFTQGDELKVEAYGNEKAIAQNDITVQNGTLIVKYKDESTGTVPTIKLLVTAPNLESIVVSGSGDIDIKDEATLEGDLSILIKGAGDVDVERVKCQNLSILISGSGDITAKKIKCKKKADISISGAGDMKADLKASDINVSISGAGDADLDVKCQNLTVSAGGTGEIELKGECAHLTKQLSGRASIDSRRLEIHEDIKIQ